MYRFGSVCVALGCLYLAPPLAAGQGTPRPAGLVEALVARYDSSWNRKDTVALGRLMAPRYQYFTSLGAVRPREAMLQFAVSPDYVLEEARRSEVVVTLTGPLAVVSSRWQGRGTYRDRTFVDDQRCGQVWLEETHTWRMVSEHCVQIAPDPWASSRERNE